MNEKTPLHSGGYVGLNFMQHEYTFLVCSPMLVFTQCWEQLLGANDLCHKYVPKYVTNMLQI